MAELSKGQMIAGTVVIVAAFVGMAMLDTDSSHHPANNDEPAASAQVEPSADTGDVVTEETEEPSGEFDSTDYVIMETAWRDADPGDRSGICVTFIINPHGAVEQFKDAATLSGLDPLPSDSTIHRFFSDKC